MENKENPVIGSLPCQNCGKIVVVVLPFYGCVFCDDCMKGNGSYEANASEFKERVK